MKVEQFNGYKNPQYGEPPGWVKLLGSIGVIPEKNGNCRWITVMEGNFFENAPTLCVKIDEDKRKDLQKRWLRHMRLGRDGAEESCEASLGISPRTWQGWEMGRAIPYYQAARLAIMEWDNQRRAVASVWSD